MVVVTHYHMVSVIPSTGSTRVTVLTLWSIAFFNVGTPSTTLTILSQTFIGRCRGTLMIGNRQSLLNDFSHAFSWYIVPSTGESLSGHNMRTGGSSASLAIGVHLFHIMRFGQWKSLAAVQRYLSFLILPDRAASNFYGCSALHRRRDLYTPLRATDVFVCVYTRVGAIPIVRLPPLDGGLCIRVHVSRVHIYTFRDPANPPHQFSGILRD